MAEAVAVIGASWFSVGPAIAADLALAGHEVRFAGFPEDGPMLDLAIRRGGLNVTGRKEGLVAGRLGFAAPALIGIDPAAALRGAGVVFLDCLVPELLPRFAAILPHLDRDALVYVQSLGYWPAARVQHLLRVAGREDVLVAEAAVPTHAARYADGEVTAHMLRGDVAVAAWPGRRSEEALARLRAFMPDLVGAPSVLQTGLEGLNQQIHPGLILLNLGHFDRCAAAGERVFTFRDGVTPQVARLIAALDVERGHICAAYGVRHRSVPEALGAHYGGPVDDHLTALQGCPYYRMLSPHPADIWRFWLPTDIAFGVVPMVRLAEQAGIGAPLHRGVVETFAALLGTAPWAEAPSLEALGLSGGAEVARRRATDG